VTCGFASAGPAADDVAFHISSDPWTSSAVCMANATRTDTVARVDVSRLLADTRATVLVCDIEGAEYDLFANLDFHDVTRICVELHDHAATGAQRRAMIQALARANFAPSSSLSRRNVFVFERV
jgi:hypothetical protein